MGKKVRLKVRDSNTHVEEAWVEIVEEREDGWLAIPTMWSDRTLKPLFYPRFAWEIAAVAPEDGWTLPCDHTGRDITGRGI